MDQFPLQQHPDEEQVVISELDSVRRLEAKGLFGILARLTHAPTSPPFLSRARAGLGLLVGLLVLSVLLQPPPFSPSRADSAESVAHPMIAPSQPEIGYMAVHNGVVFITTYDSIAREGAISAYRASDGLPLWRQLRGRYITDIIATDRYLYCLQLRGVFGRVIALYPGNGTAAWAQKTQIVGATQIYYAGGIIYLHSARGMLYAVDGETGYLLWSFPMMARLPPDRFVSVEDGYVSFESRQSVFYVLRAEDGQPVYHYSPSAAQMLLYPTIEGGILYITDADTVQARSTSSGALLWKYSYTSSGQWFPVVQHGIVLVRGPGNTMMALRGRDGRLLWQYATHSPVILPAISNGIVYLQLSLNTAIALRADDGALLWRTLLPSGPGSRPSDPLYNALVPHNAFVPPAIDNQTVYLNFYPPGRIVYALQESSGNLLWEHTLTDVTYQYAPQASNGVIYLGKDDSTIDAYSESDGRPLWSYHSPTPLQWYPLIDNGLMFVRTLDGALVVLRPRDGKHLWQYEVNE